MDASLEESMSPAFYLTPAIDDYKNNVIYINRNKRYDLSKAFTTIGHEGYPGHLYQTCYFQSQNPSPLRSMINVAGIFMNLFIGLVVAIYLLYGRRKFKKQGKLLLYSLFKERWADKIVEEIRFADRVFSGFIGGKLLDSACLLYTSPSPRD